MKVRMSNYVMNPYYVQEKVSLWGPFKFEIAKANRPKEAKNPKGFHSKNFPYVKQ